MPDAKTMGRWGVALGPEAVEQIHQRIIEIAHDHRVAAGRRMRVDTTGVETNIHNPTDSSLLGDGVRVLTRTIKKVTKIAGAIGAQLRDRSRSVKLRVLEIARTARAKNHQNSDRLAQAYQKLLEATGRVVGQAKRFAKEIDDGVKRAEGSRQAVLEGLRRETVNMVPRVQQVMRQTKTRVFVGDTHAEASLFERQPRLFARACPRESGGKAGKPTEFGKMVKLQEAEDQIVIAYEVYEQPPGDWDILITAIETHQARLRRTPHLVAADAGFYSAKNQVAAKTKGVKRVCIPQPLHQEPGAQARAEEALVPQRAEVAHRLRGPHQHSQAVHGTNRSRYRGEAGMKRWVGPCVIADNLVNISRAMAGPSARQKVPTPFVGWPRAPKFRRRLCKNLLLAPGSR
jgi:IS5 family transposase